MAVGERVRRAEGALTAPPSIAGPAVLAAVLLLAVLLLAVLPWVGGCAGAGDRNGGAAERGGLSMDAASDAEEAERMLRRFLEQHNTRASRLDSLESRASLELRYRDSDGEHFDQCEADVFLASGGRGAIRATKVGNNLLWVGSDGTRGWVFLLDKDPTSLTVYDRLDERVWVQSLGRNAAGDLILLAPQSVRVLGALGAIPADARIEPIADAPSDAPLLERWAVRYSPIEGIGIRVRFSAQGLPSETAVFDGGGRLRFVARLSDYQPAEAANLAQGAWPAVPRRIEVEAIGADVSVRIYLDTPIAMARRMKPRFFSLEELIGQLRPDSIRHVLEEQSLEVKALEAKSLEVKSLEVKSLEAKSLEAQAPDAGQSSSSQVGAGGPARP